MTDIGVRPRVVALIPTWSAEEFIEQTLETLARQTYPNVEFLISDDASPDATAAICERFAARDPRFRVMRQARNLGWVGNVNALLEAARADYLTFAFQDDLPAPTYIEECVAALESHPTAILAYSDVELIEQDGSRTEKRYLALERATSRAERARSIARIEGSWWIPNRGVFRASAATTIGGLRRHRGGEFSADWPWLIHMSLLGEFVRVPGPLVTKIYQARSLSRSWDFGVRSWSAVTESALATVWESGITTREKWSVSLALTDVVRNRMWRKVRRAAGSALRRLGLRPAAPVPEQLGR
ncbi:MAG: glycosyltransferase family 2 protein [Candidatus Eisenbacteria bacterium]|uniref:Glycosyltransferase family 2 protein n=1 Tax=Eiseniibacteriota bacterium TaxID=2212470 RepID=A0A849SFC7_UNCEI|nr:glycosyltransferase family 2 protein [Candidatus Eisenbacteria bacterium]